MRRKDSTEKTIRDIRRATRKLYSLSDVKDTLDDALRFTGLEQVKVNHKPRLLSDNGPCYVSGELTEYLQDNGLTHTRGRPYHPQTQGKIERLASFDEKPNLVKPLLHAK